MKITVLRTSMAALSLALACVTLGAAAQDPALKPNFGTVKLKAGFANDPHKVKVIAGGNLKIDKEGVKAYISKEPDFILEYEAGDFPLTIHAESKADTTLLIQGPDGKWFANDDRSEKDLNPLIKFEKPKSGKYVIWIGIYGGAEVKDKEKGVGAPAVLFITELPVK